MAQLPNNSAACVLLCSSSADAFNAAQPRQAEPPEATAGLGKEYSEAQQLEPLRQLLASGLVQRVTAAAAADAKGGRAATAAAADAARAADAAATAAVARAARAEEAEEVATLSATQLRDRLLALDPLSRDWVARVNAAEAEYWRRAAGVLGLPAFLPAC